MVDPNTRQGKRTPVTLKIKFKSETLEQFIERYAVDVSQGGIFIRTKEPLAVGTQMRFEFQLRDASPLIAGEGTVVWTRENDPSRPAIAPGMGVRFDRLAEGSQTVLERILSEKAKQAPQRPAETTKPPMFTDTPTKVAPAPVQEALLGSESARSGSTTNPPARPSGNLDGGTPLPKPVPFHSDAEDFDDRAFEEATKVRAVDELVARSAIPDGEARPASSSGQSKPITNPPANQPVSASSAAAAPIAGAPEPAAAAPTTTASATESDDSAFDRDSAPVLPSPPTVESAATKAPRVLDATPSPRTESASTPAASEDASRTKLGVEPAASSTRPAAASRTPAPNRPAVAAERDDHDSATYPTKKSSAAPIAILALVVLAAVAAAVWFFFLRDKAKQDATPATGSGSAIVATGSGSADATGSGSAAATMPPPDPGSGSAVTEDVGSAGSGSQMAATGSGSAAVEPPPVTMVDTVITTTPNKATVEVAGTDQKGAAPLTAKLEKDKAYQVTISAPGFLPTTLEVKGGAAKQTIKLAPKPKKVTVASTPEGGSILIDNRPTGKLTPATVDIPKEKLTARSIRIRIVKQGHKAVDKSLTAAAWTESDDVMTAKVEATLEKAAPPVQRPPQGSGSAGSGDGGEGNAGGDTGGTTGSGNTGSGNTGGGNTGGGNTGGGQGSSTPPPPPPDEPEPNL